MKNDNQNLSFSNKQKSKWFFDFKNYEKVSIKLLEDEYGISPGQACVFYSKDKYGEKVLGGGWIKR